MTHRSRSSGGFVLAAMALIGLAACSDGGPTAATATTSFTHATIYEDGRAIRTVRSDEPGNNRWRFLPDTRVGSHPPEGEGAPTLVRVRASTFPETASAGGEWVTLELTGRGVSLPLEVGRYPVARIGTGEELDSANLGAFGGILNTGRGISGGLDRRARTTGGELIITRVTTNTAPSLRILIEGRMDVTLEDLDANGQGVSTLRAEIQFRSVYVPGL